MPRRRKKRKKNNPLDYVYLPELNLSRHARRSIYLLIIIVLGLVSFLGLFNLAGHFGAFLTHWLELIFGWGRWLVPILLFYWAWLIVKRLKSSLRFLDIVGLFFMFVSYQTLFHFFIKQSDWQIAVSRGEGGGYVGLYLSRAFFYIFGFWGGVVVLIALFLVSFILIFNTSFSKMFGSESWLAKLLHNFGTFFDALFSPEDEDPQVDNGEDGKDYINETREEILSAWQDKAVPAKLEKVEDEDDDEGYKGENPAAAKKDKKGVQEKIKWPKRSVKIDLPIELLNNESSQAHGGDIDLNSNKIQQTLEKFGIPVEMGESKVGPTVTQYTFRPAEGIKLSRITTLSNDLSLALAAHPIRIEAPIPGKSLVGVEVPNQAKAIVGLREILESKSFKSRKNNLYVALGKDVAGASWLYDLTKMPHLLVAGATNSGKSVCLNSIIISLLYQNDPADLRFIMVDPKRVELPTYNGIPHLLTPVITDSNKTINALRWCLNEMERRYDILSQAGKRNIQSYNSSLKAGDERLPYIVFIIDELADFMMTSGKDMEAAIIRLAQMSRAIGIHLILATQRPSVDVITGLIKANIPTRIAFSVASLVDSKTILDASGAEKLLGQGDMLFSSAEMSKPKRIQGAYLSDEEINDVVSYIKDKGGPADYLEGVTDRQKVSGNAGVGLDGNHGDEDELFEAAKELIVKAGKASTSMLQRRLSIGYGRAAKILDMLEEAGIIGPSNGSKPREVMITQEQYEALSGMALSGVPTHDRASSSAPDNYLGDKDEDEDGEDALVFASQQDSSADKGDVSDQIEDSEEDVDDNEENTEDEDKNKLEDEYIEEEKDDGEPSKEDADEPENKKSHHPLDDDDEMFFAR